MTGHTPGPWELRKVILGNMTWLDIIGSDGRLVARAAIDGFDAATDEDYANANVAVAAPDLLAACAPVIDGRNYHSSSDEYMIVSLTVEEWLTIRDAIAKAKGE